MLKSIEIGAELFHELIESNSYYVDKTKFPISHGYGTHTRSKSKPLLTTTNQAQQKHIENTRLYETYTCTMAVNLCTLNKAITDLIQDAYERFITRRECPNFRACR